jgi:hypothetical protein
VRPFGRIFGFLGSESDCRPVRVRLRFEPDTWLVFDLDIPMWPFPRKVLLLFLTGSSFLSCDQELNAPKEQISVLYVVDVSDSARVEGLDSVRIRVTTSGGDTSSYFTDSQDGRAHLPALIGSRTLFEFSRRGYYPRDTVDTVNETVDTVYHRPIIRLLRIRMMKIAPVSP